MDEKEWQLYKPIVKWAQKAGFSVSRIYVGFIEVYFFNGNIETDICYRLFNGCISGREKRHWSVNHALSPRSGAANNWIKVPSDLIQLLLDYCGF